MKTPTDKLHIALVQLSFVQETENVEVEVQQQAYKNSLLCCIHGFETDAMAEGFSCYLLGFFTGNGWVRKEYTELITNLPTHAQILLDNLDEDK